MCYPGISKTTKVNGEMAVGNTVEIACFNFFRNCTHMLTRTQGKSLRTCFSTLELAIFFGA